MRKTRMTVIGAATALAMTGIALAQPLTDVVADALETNPGLRAEAARLEAAEQAIHVARARGLPTVTFEGSTAWSAGTFDPGEAGEALFQSFDNGMAQGGIVDGLGGLNQRRAQLSVVQPLFTGLQIHNGVREAEAMVEAARANFDAVRQATAFEIAEAYLAVIAADAQRETAAASLAFLTQAARAADLSFEAGQSTRTDILLAQARLEATRAQVASAQGQAVAARSQFQALAGVIPEAFDIGDHRLSVPAQAEDALAIALDRHPQLHAAAAFVQAREATLRRARGQRAPTVQLRGALSYGEDNFIDGDSSENASITAELSMPFYQGGRVRAEIRQAEAELRATRLDRQEAERMVEANLRTSFVHYQAALVAREAATAQVAAAEMAYRGVLLEQEVGQRSVLDVLQVEESLSTARLEQVNAERQWVLSAYRLRLAMGDLLDD